MKITLKYFFLCCALAFTLLLSGCGEGGRERDLKVYIDEVRHAAAQKQNAVNASSFQMSQPVLYLPGGHSATTTQSVVTPQGTSTNPLQSYPLKALQFVGTIIQNGKIHAYIMTPDSMIYEVKEGDIIGDTYDKIARIDLSHIEVSEKYIQSGKPEERMQTMRLKE
jgi:type IV pilus assembly protein PilP